MTAPSPEFEPTITHGTIVREGHQIWPPDETRQVLADIANERIRQHQKWGVQRHDFSVWPTVLMEEVGELAQETLIYREAMADVSDMYRDVITRQRLGDMRAEAVQVAAVAVAIIEHIDELLAEDTLFTPGQYRNARGVLAPEEG